MKKILVYTIAAVLLFISQLSNAQISTQEITFELDLNTIPADDTLYALRSDRGILTHFQATEDAPTYAAKRNANGRYVFHIPMPQRVAYLKIASRRKNGEFTGQADFSSIKDVLIPDMTVIEGDSILLKIRSERTVALNKLYRQASLVFTGKGSARYNCILRADSAAYHQPDTGPLLADDGTYNPGNTQAMKVNAALDQLNRYKDELNKNEYELIRSNIISSAKYNEYHLLSVHLRGTRTKLDEAARMRFLQSFQKNGRFDHQFPELIKKLSNFYYLTLFYHLPGYGIAHY